MRTSWMLLPAMLALACRGRPPGADKPPGMLKTFVSIPPQAYLVSRIGGSRVAVETMIRPGQSPATYEPTPRQMAGLAQARLYFRIGVPFEPSLLKKIAAGFDDLEVVDTRRGIKLRRMVRPLGHEGAEDDDAPGRPDPHVWLDPRLAKLQARAVAAALGRIDPAQAAYYQRNLATLEADLDRLHQKMATILAPVKGKEFFVFHPSYGYLADAYGLKQVAVELEGKEPGARQLAVLIDRAKQRRVRAIFVQPQFSDHYARVIAEEVGAEVVPLDPLAGDYLKNLEAMARQIANALATEKP